jgi:uncharacterized protein
VEDNPVFGMMRRANLEPAFAAGRPMALLPVAETDRYIALDVLRGAAVLGILVMNIQSFSMVLAAYFNPTALGPPTPADFAVWTATHLFADRKFITIFSMLFGAGLLLLTHRVEARGGRPAVVHYRRMAVLLLFGLLHAYLLWYGDILVTYAICGALVYPARTLAPRGLLIAGLLMASMASLLAIGGGLTLDSWPAEDREMVRQVYQPDAHHIARETAAFRGGWWDQFPMRAAYARNYLLFEFWIASVWRVTGMMLFGMALLKLGILTGERPQWFYVGLAAAGFGLGLPLVAWGLTRNIAANWSLQYAFFAGAQWNYWGSMLVALGWIGLVIALCQSGRARAIVRRLGAVGRMALSCYILETLICTTIFYGHGFGLFGRVARPAQMAICLGVWTLLLLIAPFWLRHFRFGPLEWLWRALSYGRTEPLVRHAASAPVR